MNRDEGSSKPPKVLVVDDDTKNREEIVSYLTANELFVAQAGDAKEMARALGAAAFDLVVFGLVLSRENPVSLCTRLAGEARPPAIIILGAAAEVEDRIIGLECGADDYLAKACNPRELLARIRAVLRPRRIGMVEGIIRISGFRLDVSRRNLQCPDGVGIRLTARESKLMEVFFSHPGRVLSRTELVDLVHGPGAEVRDRTIDVQVSRLRRKFYARTGRELIGTFPGTGYMFNTARSNYSFSSAAKM